MYVHIKDIAPRGDVKGILTDLDYTLIIPDGYEFTISPANMQVVEAAQEKDVSILPITSRSLSLTRDVLTRLGMKRGFASLDNGGSLYNIATGKYENQQWLPKAVLRDALGVIGCHLAGVACRPDEYRWEQPADIDLKTLADTPSLFAEFDNTSDTSDQIRERLESMQNEGALNFHIMSSGQEGVSSLQICAAGVSKRLGARQLLRASGIQSHQAIAIGDGRNDEPLVEAVRPHGLAIAMGNADEELKHLAGVVTDDVWHDGFARVIERFVLGQ